MRNNMETLGKIRDYTKFMGPVYTFNGPLVSLMLTALISSPIFSHHIVTVVFPFPHPLLTTSEQSQKPHRAKCSEKRSGRVHKQVGFKVACMCCREFERLIESHGSVASRPIFWNLKASSLKEKRRIQTEDARRQSKSSDPNLKP